MVLMMLLSGGLTACLCREKRRLLLNIWRMQAPMNVWEMQMCRVKRRLLLCRIAGSAQWRVGEIASNQKREERDNPARVVAVADPGFEPRVGIVKTFVI